MTLNKPSNKPANSNFSSGPCAKRPGWNINLLKNSPVGRSHRSKECKNKLKEAIDKSKLDDAILEDHWNDNGAKGEKLRKAAKLECKYFTTVLTPDSNSLHKDHFHFDNKAGLYARWHYWFGCK